MRFKAVTVLPVLAIVCLLGTVASADTKSDYDHHFNLSRLTTWEFLRPTQAPPRDAVGSNQIWDRDIRYDIQQQLTTDGFAMASNGQTPDFKVAYHMAAMEGYYGSPGWGWGWGRPWGFWGYRGWGPVWGVPFEQSTLVVDIVDTRSNQLVWRGYDNRTIDFNKSDKTISQSVDKLVMRFAHDVKESRKKQVHEK
ncbi:MAG TPA: DUF4136 domain-containing protein [Blastocatellia bacterium]